MEDFKIKKALKNNFDDYEISPKEEVFTKISDKLSETYSAEKQVSRYKIAKYIALTILLFTLGTIAFLYNFETNNNANTQLEKADLGEKNVAKIETISEYSKNIKINSDQNSATNSIEKLEKSENEAKIISPAKNLNIENSNKKISNFLSNKNISQLKTTSIAKFKKPDQLKHSSINTKNEKLVGNNFNENSIIKDLSRTDFDEIITEINIKNTAVATDSDTFSEKNLAVNSFTSNLNLIDSKTFHFIDNPLNKSGLPLNLKKIPKKELPKINKTTPLAMEFSINPFYAFQKIEPTAAGLANIQNISTGKIDTKQRLGLAINAGYVINWSKQSRLRLGVSYRDIFQKVGYELATDTYEFQTINGYQTVLVRKGIPYAEEKRNQLIGIKADRQFFLQLSTPTRFYASLGAEYTKALKSKAQMLFVNTTMGIDCPIGLKTKLQIEPSYAYALLGSTDALKNVSLNPNHIGLRIGVLYEIRK